MLLVPENTTVFTAACVNGCAGVVAGGVGLKLSRITSTLAVDAAVTAPGPPRRGLGEHGDRAGRDARRALLARDVHAHAGSQFDRRDRKIELALLTAVLAERPHEAARAALEVVGMEQLYRSLDGDRLRRRGRLRGRLLLMLLDDDGTARRVPGSDHLRSLAHGHAGGELDPRHRTVVADQRIDTLMAGAVEIDEVEDRESSLHRYGRTVRQARRLRLRVVRVDMVRVDAGHGGQRERRDRHVGGRPSQ